MRGYRIWVIVAVVCALGAAYLSMRTIQGYVGQTSVIVAAKDLSPDQVITANDLQWATYPKGALYRDTVLDPSQAEGYVAKGFVPAGTVLRGSMLAPGYTAAIPGRLAQLGKDGTKYFALALPENVLTTVGGQVFTGEHVDVYLTGNTTPLAQDATVLYGIQSTQTASAQQGIVIAVDTQQEQAILPYLFQTGGKASLVLVIRPGKGE